MTRFADAWRALEREQRLTAVAALGLFVSMFLPWYSETVVSRNVVGATQTSLTAFQDFSFVEAAVLLVSAGVLAMLFARAERRSFQLPAGDGLIVMIAGGWTALLIFYRLLDKPGVHSKQTVTATVGVQWGIFLALLIAIGLLYAGARMRTAGHVAAAVDDGARGRQASEREDAVMHDDAREQQQTTVLPRPGPQTAASTAREGALPSGRPRFPPAPAEQMSFEDQPRERS